MYYRPDTNQLIFSGNFSTKSLSGAPHAVRVYLCAGALVYANSQMHMHTQFCVHAYLRAGVGDTTHQ